jgi:PEP-CTERM motif-containing protein
VLQVYYEWDLLLVRVGQSVDIRATLPYPAPVWIYGPPIPDYGRGGPNSASILTPAANLAATPEPTSILLFGTGLLTSIGRNSSPARGFPPELDHDLSFRKLHP